HIFVQTKDGIRDSSVTGVQTCALPLTSFLARRAALLQICSNPAALADGFTDTPAKLLALDRILQDRVERHGEKVVVWSFYTASLAAIFDRYRGMNPVRYD